MMVIQIVSLEIERWLFLLISRPLFTGTSRYQLQQLLVLVEGGEGGPSSPHSLIQAALLLFLI